MILGANVKALNDTKKNTDITVWLEGEPTWLVPSPLLQVTSSAPVYTRTKSTQSTKKYGSASLFLQQIYPRGQIKSPEPDMDVWCKYENKQLIIGGVIIKNVCIFYIINMLFHIINLELSSVGMCLKICSAPLFLDVVSSW